MNCSHVCRGHDSKETGWMRSLLALLIVLGISMPTQAQEVTGFVESWNLIQDSGTTPEINVYAVGNLKGKLGWSAWNLITADWSEALIGLTYAPTKWVEVSGSLGIETADDPLRQGASIWLGKGRWSLLSIHENGGSGYWYRLVGTYQLRSSTLVGFNSHRYFGTGPYVSQSFGKVSFWGAYAIGENKAVLSARYSF